MEIRKITSLIVCFLFLLCVKIDMYWEKMCYKATQKGMSLIIKEIKFFTRSLFKVKLSARGIILQMWYKLLWFTVAFQQALKKIFLATFSNGLVIL